MKVSLFQGILLGVFGVGALIGLFVFSTYTSKNAATSVGPVVIWGTLAKADMDATITFAAQTQPVFKNITYIQKDPSTLPSELSSAIATGGAPDLVLDSQENLIALSKFITPLDQKTLSPADFTNSFAAGATIFAAPQGAGYYGIPFLIDPIVLYANRSMLSSLGVARAPATWESLTGLVPSVATFTPNKQIVRSLIALGTYANVHNARGILSTLFLQTAVPLSEYANDGTTLVANLGTAENGGVPPGRSVVNFYTQFADPSKVSYTWNASLKDSQQAFLAGDLALYLGYASEARFLVSANPNLDFVVSPVPQPGTAAAKHTYGLIYAFMIPRGAKNAQGGYQIATLLAKDPSSQEAFSRSTGLSPASLSGISQLSVDPVAAVVRAEALYTQGWLSPQPLAADQIFSGMIGDVVTGRSMVPLALINAQSALTALLQK